MNFIISFVLYIVLFSVVILSFTGYGYSYSYYDTYDMLNIFTSLGWFALIFIVWAVLNCIPGLSIVIRRLHDTGRSWPWIFISLIPFAGGIILIVLMAMPTENPRINQFGVLRQV